MVLISLLLKCFGKNLLNFPAHVIHVRKQEFLNIQSIYFSNQEYQSVVSYNIIDMSKLEELCKI